MALQEGHKSHPSYQFRDRCQCLLLSNEGKQVKDLALILQVSPISIYTWFNRWEEKDLAGLVNAKGQGRKFILSAAEGDTIKEKVQANAQQLKVTSVELRTELNKAFCEKTLKRF